MIKYKLNNIRDLVGPKVDLQMVYNNPICRLEKVAGDSQKRVKTSLEEETTQNYGNNTWKKCEKPEKHNFVIFCDPGQPMRWLESLIKFTKNHLKISLTTHLHSSVQRVPRELESFCSEFTNSQKSADLTVTFIWKSVGVDPVLKLDGNREIFGQVNVARYFNRLIEQTHPSLLRYESKGALYANKIDGALERIHNALHNSRGLKLNDLVKSNSRYIFEEISIVDLILEGLR